MSFHNSYRYAFTAEYTYLDDALTDMKWIEIDGSDSSFHFTYDATGPMSMTFYGTEYFYLKNAQGDVVGLVDSSGTQVVAYTYDAWGNILSTTGSMAGSLGYTNPFRYRGYFYDTETGLYYLDSRYYNPQSGRFISADSESLVTASPENAAGDKNQFAYCDNNPVVRVDDGGRFWHILISGAINAAVSFGLELASQAIALSWTGKPMQIDNFDFTKALISAGAGFVSGAVTASGLGFGVTIGLNAALGAMENVATDIYTNNKDGEDRTDYSVGEIIARATISAGTSALTTYVSGPSDGAAMNRAYKERKAGKAYLQKKGNAPSYNRIAHKQVNNYKKKLGRYTWNECKGSPASGGAGKIISTWLQKIFRL